MKKKNIYTISGEERYQDGQEIFKEGTIGNGVYMILSGAVETSRDINDKRFVIEKIEEGALVGEAGLMGDSKHTVTARSVGDTTLGVLDMEPLKKEYNQLSKQFKSIIETLPLRLEKILDRACDFSD